MTNRPRRSPARWCASAAALLVPAGFAAAAINGTALDTNPPPQSLGSCALIAFPADQSPIGSLVTSVPGPLGPLGLNPGLLHETVAMTISSPAMCHGYSGDMYRSNSLPGTPITFTMPPNTVEFVFYAVDDFGGLTYTVDATTLSGATTQIVSVGGPFFGNCIGFGFITDDPCDPIDHIVFNSTIPAVGAPTWVGDFRICTTQCGGSGGGCVVEAGQCCFGEPDFEDAAYAGITGPVAVVTAGPNTAPGPGFGGGQVVMVFDLATTYTAPTGVAFNVPRYSHPTWIANNLGGIFGITLDGDGNIYVTSTSLFGPFTGIAGTLGGVYRIDRVTSVVSLLTTLPNAGNPGLGNIVYDCENDQFFVTNHQDGRVWRLDSTGNCQSTFDHATNTIQSCTPEAGSGFVPLGERIWGVTVHAGRVYYCVWNEDMGTPSAALTNEVWSIALSGTGNFTGAAQLEAQIPSYPSEIWSMPGSDIRFSATGNMLVAQRGMSSDTNSVPHRATIIEFACLAPGGWTPTGNTFFIGEIASAVGSAAGGIDDDYATSGRVWATGDAVKFDFATPIFVYGIQGSPETGGTPANSVLVDFQNNLTQQDKGSICDVAISCQQCMEIDVEEIDCTADGSGDYSVQFNVTNNSGQTAYYGLVPAFAKIPNDNSVTLSPNVIVFNPPLASGATTTTPIKVFVSGGEVGEEICFNFVIANETVQECCSTQICVELEKCCFEIEDKVVSNVSCLADGSVRFDWSFNLVNVSGDVLEHLFIISQTAGVTVNPSYFDLPTVANGGSAPIAFTVSGATPGTPFSLLITVHNGALEECCAELKTSIAPDCPPLIGACCRPGACVDLTEVECDQIGGFWVAGASCADGVDPCAGMMGACCLPPAPPTCQQITFADCQLLGGVFLANTSCNPDPCGSVAGACCLPNPPGACAQVTELGCQSLGGVFNAAEQCDPGICPAPVVCACDLNGDNTVGFADMTLLLLGWGAAHPGTGADLDQSGDIGFSDLTLLLLEWGPC